MNKMHVNFMIKSINLLNNKWKVYSIKKERKAMEGTKSISVTKLSIKKVKNQFAICRLFTSYMIFIVLMIISLI